MGLKRKKRRRTKPESGKARPEAVFPTEREKEVVARVFDLSEPLCESEGVTLVHVEYQREQGGRMLRLYIDKPEGVALDDCVQISRQLSDILDVQFEDIGPYNLEVSSPGPNRPLGRPEDFEKFKGNEAKIKLSRPIDGQKNFRGVLLGLSDENVNLLVDGKTVALPFQDIVRARLVNYNGENRC